MSSALEKSLGLLERMAQTPQGMSVSQLSEELELPASGVHRQLQELSRLGYVRQEQSQGNYTLTIRLAAVGLGFLGRSGVTDIAQPILDRLAREAGELIRLSVFDSGRLTWVAVAQGATSGLRYDPGREQGVVVHLASSAGGRALLARLPERMALAMLGEQGLEPDFEHGSKAPKSIAELMNILETTRKRGYSVAIDSYLQGMAAMAVTIEAEGHELPLGCLSIAGPSVRFTEQRIEELHPALSAAADELGQAANASHYFAAFRSPSFAERGAA